MKFPYVKWTGYDAGKERKKVMREPKCHRSIRGDSDGFWLLMACEDVAAAAREACHYSHWKSMFDV